MQLTAAQVATFKTWLNNNAVGLADDAAAALANQPNASPIWIWNPSASKGVVDSQIVKRNYTPTDAPPLASATDQSPLLWNNRALQCQLMQFNAQWLTTGLGSIDARVTGTRQNFFDCMRGIPSGTGGASQDSGWGPPANPGAVRIALMRQASNFEALYVTSGNGTGPGNDGTSATGAQTNPAMLGFDNLGLTIEGPITSELVAETRAS